MTDIGIAALCRKAAYKLHRSLFPREPWIAPAAVRFLRSRLREDDILFEWGSGESTVWFARRVRRVISVESDHDWYERVLYRLREEGLKNVDLRYLPWQSGGLPLGDWGAGASNPYVRAASEVEDKSCDWIIIDGIGREACVLEALGKVKPGGHLLIDNTDYRPRRDWRVPETWPIRSRSRYSDTETTIWQKPSGDGEGEPR